MGRKTAGVRGTGQGGDQAELARLKLELVAAQERGELVATREQTERGERGALGRAVTAHPAVVGELTQFAAALVATSGYERETPTAETQAVAERAFARALGAAFPPVAAPVATPVAGGLGARAAATLRALRKARGISLAAAARRLGLGVDVLQNLEAGLIRAASVPNRLTRALGELLEASADQVRGAIESQLVLRPALQRARTADAGDPEQLDFADAVRLSPAMSDEQRHAWLDAPDRDA
ncbi:MAG TPA: helix-turn-helix domain-containing protein [Ktedonobacterales bacterium]|jgi:transcriptional regulator with XRE-family HTH domain